MNKQLVVVLALALTIGSAFLILSCSPGTQNTNTGANANSNGANSVSDDEEAKIAESDEPCKQTSVEKKIEKLQLALEKKISEEDEGSNNKDHLKYQYKQSFFLEFAEGTGNESGWVIAYVSGAVQGQKKFKKLADFIEDFVAKDCQIKIVYKAKPQPSPSPGLAPELRYPPTGFEWCESPMQACPGGYCAVSCDYRLEGSNTNKGQNTNLNGNSRNANSNGNRSP